MKNEQYLLRNFIGDKKLPITTNLSLYKYTINTLCVQDVCFKKCFFLANLATFEFCGHPSNKVFVFFFSLKMIKCYCLGKIVITVSSSKCAILCCL